MPIHTKTRVAIAFKLSQLQSNRQISDHTYHGIDNEGSKQEKDILTTAAAFKYKKFYLYDDAIKWYKENEREFQASDESLINFAKEVVSKKERNTKKRRRITLLNYEEG